MKFQPKHPWCKKSSGQELIKAGMKKMWNQIGLPRPPAVVGIKIFDNDDEATKHSERRFCGVVIIIKNFNFINSSRPWPPNFSSHLPSLVLGHYFFCTRGDLFEIWITYLGHACLINYKCYTFISKIKETWPWGLKVDISSRPRVTVLQLITEITFYVCISNICKSACLVP